MLPRFIRNAGFKLAKSDIIQFLDDHEEEFISHVRQRLEELDNRTPEEKIYIDIHMAALGEQVARAMLDAIRDFMRK